MAYIYQIKNKVNNKVYIGSTNNYINRWGSHKWQLNNNKHKNLHLQSSWNKYGSKNFEFTVIEECSEKEKFKREQFYIDMIQPFSPNGYNICKNAGMGLMCEQEYRKRKFNGDKHPLATITNAEVIKIKKLLAEGVTQKHIVDKLGYSWGIVSKIASLLRWKEIGAEYNEAILKIQRKKWNDEMEYKLIKFVKENKPLKKIKHEFDIDESALRRRYNYIYAKLHGKIKICTKCNKEFIINSNNQKRCKKCSKKIMCNA